MFLVRSWNIEILVSYSDYISNVYQMCIFQIFYKCFTNLFQMSNLSFFVNSRDKLIHSLAAFSLINISIAINPHFSGAWAATQKVSVISKSYIFGYWIYFDRSQQILSDLSRSSHIPIDFERSWQIFTEIDTSWYFYWLVDLLNLSQAATITNLIKQGGWQPQGLFLDLIAAAVTHKFYL